MTRLDAEATETVERPVAGDAPRSLLLHAREVPLGGVRGMKVSRALPQRELPMVGAWCFLDRFGPQVTTMRVEPHPHIGLQTVTWPFAGQTRHRDAIGSDVVIARGQLNIMTSGAGISHSEYSVGDDPVETDALQLWVALPESRRHGEPGFERHVDLPIVDLGGGAAAVVLVGHFGEVSSPAVMHTPIVGAEVFVPAGTRVTLPLDPRWEHAIVGVDGAPLVVSDPAPVAVPANDLLYLGVGREGVEIAADTDATVFLLGGEPFEDDIVMWWNFVGRSHDEIVAAREDWEAGSPRFGHVVAHGDERIPAPPMPTVRLTRRRRRP
ncbi:pirin family protein [Microbacterium sp. 179-B 1A2 NHS]|uniref:pirin family protein n=1 Tax=Microbacterium sp. 179-B 1A2 NHS TaxID=3142383 RepID=UPI0039A1658D